MPFGLHSGKDARDPALAIDYKGGAFYSHHLLAVHVLLFENSEGIDHLLFRVCQERIRKVVFLLKFLLSLRGISRYAEYSRTGLFDSLECVAEPARLDRSARSVRFGKEEQHHCLCFKIFKRDLLALFVQKRKIRSFVVDFHAVPFPTIS